MGYSGLVLYQIAAIVSIVASLAMLVIIWNRRHINGMKAMMVLLACIVFWTLFSLLETNSLTLEGQKFFYRLQFLVRMVIPPAWLVFATNYTIGKQPLTGLKLLSVCIAPLILLLTGWFGGANMLTYNEYLVQSGPFLVTERSYGIGFWISAVHNYILIIAGAVVLFKRLITGFGLYKRQAFLIIVAASIPFFWNIIYVFDLIDIPHKDFSPLSFTVSMIILVFGLVHLNLFSTIPFARRFLLQNVREGILVFDMQARLLEANRAALAILNVTGDYLGKKGEEIPAVSRILDRLPSDSDDITELSLNVNDEERIFELETVRMQDNKERDVGQLVVLRDITERKQLQGQLIARDRLASIGELTSGVAHEINNPLAVIKMVTELLQKNDFSDMVRKDINVISEETDRIIKIVENLLTFARRQPSDKMNVDINEILEKTLSLRVYEQEYNNVFTAACLKDNLPGITGNALQLQQVFFNIIINAEFFVNKTDGESVITVSTDRKDDFVCIRIGDNGPGIPPQDIKNIFIPFFTTKGIGDGTGLGLSICHGIIAEHGGSIHVESTVGEGTTFEILLPVCEEAKENSLVLSSPSGEIYW